MLNKVEVTMIPKIYYKLRGALLLLNNLKKNFIAIQRVLNITPNWGNFFVLLAMGKATAEFHAASFSCSCKKMNEMQVKVTFIHS